jgi:hypothetical protein
MCTRLGKEETAFSYSGEWRVANGRGVSMEIGKPSLPITYHLLPITYYSVPNLLINS